MRVQGSLEVLRLPEILQMLAQQRRTGILTLQGTEDIVAVSFLEGRVVAADALNQTVEEGLGKILIERSWVAPDELRNLARASERGEGRLIDLLVDRQVLDRERLLEVLRVQNFRLLLGLLGWTSGEFKFYGGDEVSYEEGVRPLAVDEVLLRAAEEESRGAEHELPGVDSQLRRVEGRRVQIRPLGEAPPAEAEEDTAAEWLSPEEAALLQALASGRRLGEAASAIGLNKERARYLGFGLLRRGLVEAAPATTQAGTAAAMAAMAPMAPGSPDGLDASLDEIDALPLDAALDRPSAGALARDEGRRTALGGDEAGVSERAERAAAREPAPRRETSARDDHPRRLSRVGQREPVAAVSLAAALALVVVTVTLLAPVRLLLPLPWQEAERGALADTRRNAAILQIDRALDLYFLLEGRYPDGLARLVERGLLAPADLALPDGSRIAYTADETGYFLAGGEVDDAARIGDSSSLRRSIDGNFLLDPELAAPDEPSNRRPLVLLD